MDRRLLELPGSWYATVSPLETKGHLFVSLHKNAPHPSVEASDSITREGFSVMMVLPFQADRWSNHFLLLCGEDMLGRVVLIWLLWLDWSTRQLSINVDWRFIVHWIHLQTQAVKLTLRVIQSQKPKHNLILRRESFHSIWLQTLTSRPVARQSLREAEN